MRQYNNPAAKAFTSSKSKSVWKQRENLQAKFNWTFIFGPGMTQFLFYNYFYQMRVHPEDNIWLEFYQHKYLKEEKKSQPNTSLAKLPSSNWLLDKLELGVCVVGILQFSLPARIYWFLFQLLIVVKLAGIPPAIYPYYVSVRNAVFGVCLMFNGLCLIYIEENNTGWLC